MDRTLLQGTLGGVVGCLGWWIGLTVVCLASGNGAAWTRFALPGLVLSLGVAGVLVLTGELLLRTCGRGPTFRIVLLGELAFFVGLLVLLTSHWIAPVVDATPSLRDAIVRLGGVYRTNDLLPTLLMATGAVLMALAFVRMARDGTPPST